MTVPVKIDNAKVFKRIPWKPGDSNVSQVIKHNCTWYKVRKKKIPGICKDAKK